MKKLILLSYFIILPAFADFLDEQDLCTEDKTCCFHSLTTKTRHLWTIDVDKSYCHDGLVQGFTTVTLKDSLNRTVETLHGFFHQGYWLTNFVGNINTFYRFSPDEGVQDFIFKSGEDKELHLTYYSIARATQSDGEHYSAFTTCAPETSLLIAHDPITDFKQSLFQSALLKQAQKHQLKLCPETDKIHILGIPQNSHSSQDKVFQADVDLKNEEISISYHAPIDKNAIPKPSELRHEDGENILTIRPQKQEQITVTYGEALLTHPSIPQTLVPKRKDVQSATDLALTAKIMDNQVSGSVVVYVDRMSEQHAIVTRPFPLVLQTQTALSPGWYVINGTFTYDGQDNIVQVLSATSCQKEWCEDEN